MKFNVPLNYLRDRQALEWLCIHLISENEEKQCSFVFAFAVKYTVWCSTGIMGKACCHNHQNSIQKRASYKLLGSPWRKISCMIHLWYEIMKLNYQIQCICQCTFSSYVLGLHFSLNDCFLLNQWNNLTKCISLKGLNLSLCSFPFVVCLSPSEGHAWFTMWQKVYCRFGFKVCH